MSLNTLPEELLLRILELTKEVDPVPDTRNFESPQCPPSLVHLAHTCRRLNRLATPFAYEELNSQRRHVERFVGTITANPRLGALVKHVYWECRDKDNYDDMSVLDRQQSFARVRAWLWSLERDPEWVSQFKSLVARKEELGACLRRVPRVERLEVVDFFGGDEEEVHWLDVGRAGNKFGWLGEFRLVVSKLHVRTLLPVLQLPAMRRLELSGMAVIDVDGMQETPLDDPTDRETHVWGVPAHSSPIEHLHIKHSGLDSEVTCNLLRLFAHLSSFEHHSIDDTTSKAPNYPLIIHSLSHHASSLKSLTLYDTLDLTSPSRPLLPSLSHFTSLTHISIPYTSLFDLSRENLDPAWTDVLPQGVEKLVFLFAEEYYERDERDSRYARGFAALAEGKKAGAWPGLKEVEIEVSSEWREAGRS